MNLYEILVPTAQNTGRPIRTRMHREWDSQVRRITGGLTILTPARGQWVSPDGTQFNERMIPVRVMCSSEQIERIADLTAGFYRQEAVMFYKISDEVRIKHYGRVDDPEI
jgi:hypothetical protein